MAAMAPALTDAPAEAHRIRFKLAPPSSTLSPSGVEGNGGASHLLVSSSSTVKRKASEERPSRGAGPCKREEGKLQPLVASYLCSDVTPVPSTKESLKLQGVLLQTHGILPGFLPRHPTLELSEEQLKSIMSGGSGAPSVQAPPVNGMAKKLTKPGIDRDNAVTMNGGKHSVDSDSLPQSHVAVAAAAASRGGLTGNGPLRGDAGHEQRTEESQNTANNAEQIAPPSTAHAPSDLAEDKASDRPPSLNAETPAPPPQARQHSLGGLGTELRDRTQQSQNRQCEIEGRLRRLRKRLQVVQAKQVERHVQQQLGGLVETTLGSLDTFRQRRHHGDEALAPQEREGLGRFLKGGSVPAELERLSVSGTTNLRAAEGAFDSDATESSSGGETDVEEDELARVDIDQRHISLWRRAEGRYALERASIISHWNWLQAQVSDLEYRIRQQTDIYRQVRSSKGSVVLGEGAPAEQPPEDQTEVNAEPLTCTVTQERGADGAEGSLSTHAVATETSLRKGCGAARQVNGVISSLRSGSPGSTDPEDQLRKQQQRPPLVPSPPDDATISARTRPLLSCKRRRLIRSYTISNLNRKSLLQGQRVGGASSGSCDINPQCATCGGRSALPLSDAQHERPLLERLSQFDSSVHPILSFTDDVMMSLHMQRVLKTDWQSRPLEKIKPIKKLSLKHKLSLNARYPDPSCSSSSVSKDKHKPSASLLTTVRLPHQKVRPEKLHRQSVDSVVTVGKLEGRQTQMQLQHRADRSQSSHASYDKSHSRKRPREHSVDRMDNGSKLYMEVSSPCPSLSGMPASTHSPLMRQLSASESASPIALNSSTPPIRRRRGESSFDINNIVIPMSVAATTRVEKLQYKEILTPSWRVVDICSKPISEEDDAAEIEDLSDAAFSQLHQPLEEQERSRWSWTASSIAKRRGSRSYKSLDGRSTPLLGGTNPSTPQPSSPDTAHFHLLQDYSSAPSPCSPASPDLLLSNPYTPASRDSHRFLSNEDTRCSTPDNSYEEMIPQPVQPWEHRTFPLEAEPSQELEDQDVPVGERPGRTARRISGSKTGSSKSESDAGPPSPLPDESGKQKNAPAPKPTRR
ncbi:KAT8 regulatory NSL complex subunit 1 isoform X2 [Chanos chanos]|uniref:KAT8 regulatory NSL complex subunit 1 isoform X2 n=1 Tax=Chanos chanos TaxID=29144 RepID=A0A6J2WZJ1_CHACN|nr:KAT8 regulatory NSL complex subunit 1-like isoform X2 [Chanos chanos]